MTIIPANLTWSDVVARRMARHALDDEAGLVGAVMQAAPALTVGPVTVGPHA